MCKALEILPQLAADKRGPFDLVFIDADKPGTPDYFAWALKLSHMGTLIIADNVVRKDALIDATAPIKTCEECNASTSFSLPNGA